MFGYLPHEKEHNPSAWREMVHQMDLKEAMRNFQKHVETRGSHPYLQECRYRHKNGTWVWVLCRGKVIEWDKTSNDWKPLRMVGTHTDITLSKQDKQLIKNQQGKLKEFQQEIIKKKEELQMKAQFMSRVCHEVRTPLTGIMGFLELSKDKVFLNTPEKLDNFLSTMEKCGNRLMTIVNDVLDLSSIEREAQGNPEGKANETSFKTFDIGKVLDECATLFQHSNCKITVKILPDKDSTTTPISNENLQLMIHSDEAKVSRTVVNLINNATKFTDNGRIDITARYSVASGIVNIQVKDNGIGVAPEDQEIIFQKFSQVDESSARKMTGAGIGLCLCRSIARALGGDVTVQSMLGLGSIFTVTIQATGKYEIPMPVSPPSSTHTVDTPSSYSNKRPRSSSSGPLEDTLKVIRDEILKKQKLNIGKKIVDKLNIDNQKNNNNKKNDKELEKIKKNKPTHVLTSANDFSCLDNRILLAEDDDVNIMIFKRYLEKLGIKKVRVAKNGEEAVAAFEKKFFDVILMDCQMPVMDGITASVKIREMCHCHKDVHKDVSDVVASRIKKPETIKQDSRQDTGQEEKSPYIVAVTAHVFGKFIL
jgi:signal transduction histidine kinase